MPDSWTENPALGAERNWDLPAEADTPGAEAEPGFFEDAEVTVPMLDQRMRFWHIFEVADWLRITPSAQLRGKTGTIIRLQLLDENTHTAGAKCYFSPAHGTADGTKRVWFRPTPAEYRAQAWTGFPTYFITDSLDPDSGGFMLRSIEPRANRAYCRTQVAQYWAGERSHIPGISPKTACRCLLCVYKEVPEFCVTQATATNQVRVWMLVHKGTSTPMCLPERQCVSSCRRVLTPAPLVDRTIADRRVANMPDASVTPYQQEAVGLTQEPLEAGDESRPQETITADAQEPAEVNAHAFF